MTQIGSKLSNLAIDNLAQKEKANMQISRRADYGVRVILDLSTQSGNSRVSTEEIAARQRIPTPFLAKIISQLSLAGLVATCRGAGGGVTLSKPCSEISLLQVIEALEGPIQLNRCMIEAERCPRDEYCPVHDVWAKAQAGLTALLGATTFNELAAAEQTRGRPQD
jgi:Rrf2 family protein